ncbi:unnamed protein product, partial [Musa textilis]
MLSIILELNIILIPGSGGAASLQIASDRSASSRFAGFGGCRKLERKLDGSCNYLQNLMTKNLDYSCKAVNIDCSQSPHRWEQHA